MAIDPEITRHKEWLGFLQPVGLVVSPPALVKAQAVINRNIVDLQQSLLAAVDEDGYIADFPAFVVNVFSLLLKVLIANCQTLDYTIKHFCKSSIGH
ncbi:hypothetical protein COO91_01084 [Nostoc flagelliforme CCNUN1]|uniref:Uncharacterized protein n=1 Tax=Nostoc flagelliforme CCNUN1 TaxID=2038116 RepID=A0A2K8SID2_9NOSO|nr:hypothetical protein [Nostoc flagelliforme]AUB35212.1 hypothetical protein COO91_01084 [Nostoc flagelliforme CCNUN1]